MLPRFQNPETERRVMGVWSHHTCRITHFDNLFQRGRDMVYLVLERKVGCSLRIDVVARTQVDTPYLAVATGVCVCHAACANDSYFDVRHAI
jgi:hypothetical protein